MLQFLSIGVTLKTGETRASPMDARRQAVLGRLIDVAERLLTRQSVADIGLMDILEAADVAKATFYKLFDDLPHFYRYVAEGFHITLREYQLDGSSKVDREDWRAVLGHISRGGARFYMEHPAAMRLWLGLDSPPNIRAVDQASDEIFLRWIHGQYADTAWHAKLPDADRGIDVLTASFRIYDAVLALGFQRRGSQVPQYWFDEADRASSAFVALYLDRN